MVDVLDCVTEGVLRVDDDLRVTAANEATTALFERDEDSIVGADIREVFPRSANATFHDHVENHRASDPETSFEEYFPEIDAWLAGRLVRDDPGFVVIVEDVSSRKALERDLADSEAELTRLTRINAIIHTIIRELVGATTREETEQTVCERLAAANLYEYIWIGERSLTDDRLRERRVAGEYEGVIDLAIEEEGEPDGPSSPERRAIEEGTAVVVRHLVEDDSVPERIRRESFAHGLQSSVAVPIRYGGSTYGVIGVYATHPDAFSERERESLETLGEVVGFVINAARQRNLLLSDTAVELTFRLTGSNDGFLAASTRLACELAVTGIVPLSDDSTVCFVEVTGADPSEALGHLTDQPVFTTGRVIRDAPADGTLGGLLEVTLTGVSPLSVLIERGATIRTAEFDDQDGRIVADVAPGEDIRELVEAVGETHSCAQLHSKRERERTVETAQEFRSALHDRLTDRQRTVLRTAFYGGYFKSPRDSTAEELAATLDISSPTLHGHLRAGEWKLLDAFFKEDAEYERHPRRSDQGTENPFHDATN